MALVVQDFLEDAKVQGTDRVEVVEVGLDRPKDGAKAQKGDFSASNHTGTSSAAIGKGSTRPQNRPAALT